MVHSGQHHLPRLRVLHQTRWIKRGITVHRQTQPGFLGFFKGRATNRVPFLFDTQIRHVTGHQGGIDERRTVRLHAAVNAAAQPFAFQLHHKNGDGRQIFMGDSATFHPDFSLFQSHEHVGGPGGFQQELGVVHGVFVGGLGATPGVLPDPIGVHGRFVPVAAVVDRFEQTA